MATIKMIQPVSVEDNQQIRVLGRPALPPTLARIREAFERGDLVRESAGPGWGSHNALLRPRDNISPDELGLVYEPWWGYWLATIED